MKIGILVAGILSLLLAILHIPQVWQYFFPSWTRELEKLSLVNRKLVTTILVALALTLLVFALTSLIYAEELSLGGGLATGIATAYSLFWLWRTLWQVFYFVPSRIEHDNKLLIFHYSLIVVFIVLFVVYLLPVASSLAG